ncbi:hypothetical protein, partial [Klebsiella pneumoniae]|uniref:hypothetical protein n=1 Tax=Klebsiella pneumoniae TaxID=573 RepID=UPI003718F572
IVPRRAGDASAGMSAGAAMVEAWQRAAVVGVAQHRPGGKQLVQRQGAMENVTADQPEVALEIERGQHLAGD